MNKFDREYSIIYADPPYEYQSKGTRSANNHYDTINIIELGKLNIRKICYDHTMLFLWCPYSNLRYGMYLIRRWGFEYKNNVFIWIKLNKKNNKPFIGMGSYTRNNAECILLGISKNTHAKKQIIDHGISQLVFHKRLEHSKKPDVFRDKIDRLVGDVSKIELFSRDKLERDNWEYTGLESDGIDISEAL